MESKSSKFDSFDSEFIREFSDKPHIKSDADFCKDEKVCTDYQKVI